MAKDRVKKIDGDEEPFKIDIKNISFKEFFSCIKGYGVETILAPFFIVLEVILEVFIPFIMASLIDKGIGNGQIPPNLNEVWKYGGIMLALAFGALVTGVLSARFAAVASQGFGKNLRKKLFDAVQSFSFRNVDKFSHGSLITRLTTDVTFIQNTFMMLIRIAFRAPVMFAFSIAMAMSINVKLSLIFVAIAPLMILGIVIVGIVVFPLFGKMFKKFDRMNSRLQENLRAIRVVKAFVREDHETENFRKTAADIQRAQVRAERVMVYAQPMVQFCMYACMVCVIWFGGNMVLNETGMSLGELNSFISYISQILMSLLTLAMIFVNIFMTMQSAARTSEVLSERPDINDEQADASLEVADSSISFENVNFGYSKGEDKLVLKNINLQIGAGETVGIIGGTGSSKSTLVQLIPRLYDVSSGCVKVGGRDIRDYTIHTLRDSVAMVLQKNVLFSGTIRENLKWGNENATEEEIISACKVAQAHDFVTSFPDGYETDLGQGGVNVSGGQKQRLCIARALIKKPKIMILDDSTSAVDTATDARIRRAFREELKDTTVIIIAQRITSISDCDKIIVMDNGEITDIGTHEELYEKSEIYREVCISQQKGVK
ncbi:MAG: ABC transporter ATP-binding protein [Clostridia bacterium]|nr:ABC transporter ATP-binding protein [Clostridia bacterium]